MSNKNIILTTVGVIIAILLFIGMRYVVILVKEDITIRHAQHAILKAKEEYAKCQIVITDSKAQASDARDTLKELGVSETVVQDPFSQLQQEQKLGAERTLTGPAQN